MITKFKLFEDENTYIDDVSTWKEGDFVYCINNEKQEWLTIGKPYKIDRIEFGKINKDMGIKTVTTTIDIDVNDIFHGSAGFVTLNANRFTKDPQKIKEYQFDL